MSEPFVLFDKTYWGFESASDIGRDIHEMWDARFNPPAAKLPGEFQGKLKITITYEPDEDDPPVK